MTTKDHFSSSRKMFIPNKKPNSYEPIYHGRCIRSIAGLADELDRTPSELIEISSRANQLYTPLMPAKRLKKDGSVRWVRSTLEPLHSIQVGIKEKILDRTVAPAYLMGGIRNSATVKRGIKANASLHSGSTLVINEDILLFFTSIHFNHISQMWRELFGFSARVSDLLSRLVCKGNELPLGATTSSSIANFILYDVEPSLVDKLWRRGFTYSRLVDDITVSTKNRATSADTGFVVRNIISVLARKGLQIKRSKHSIAHRSGRQTLHGIRINHKELRMPEEARRITTSIHRMCHGNRDVNPLLLERITGRISFIAGIDERAGVKLLKQLHSYIPQTTIQEIRSHLSQVRAGRLDTKEFFARFSPNSLDPSI